MPDAEDDKVIRGSIYHVGCDRPMMTSDEDDGMLTCPVCGFREIEGTVVEQLTMDNVVSPEIDEMLGGLMDMPNVTVTTPTREPARFKLIEN